MTAVLLPLLTATQGGFSFGKSEKIRLTFFQESVTIEEVH